MRTHVFVIVLATALVPFATARAQSCVPTCRTGFVCSAGRCISACNPACPTSYACTAEGTCAPVSAPPRTVRATRANMPILATSGIVLAVMHALSPAVTGIIGAPLNEVGYMALPLVGPWICIAECQDPSPYLPALIADGVLQDLALIGMILGAALRQEVEVRAAGPLVLPWAGLGSAGAMLAMSFD